MIRFILIPFDDLFFAFGGLQYTADSVKAVQHPAREIVLQNWMSQTL
jgi:hypothetical protein